MSRMIGETFTPPANMVVVCLSLLWRDMNSPLILPVFDGDIQHSRVSDTRKRHFKKTAYEGNERDSDRHDRNPQKGRRLGRQSRSQICARQAGFSIGEIWDVLKKKK